MPSQVFSKTGNSVIIETPSGTWYSRNTSHVEIFGMDDPASTFKTQSVCQDEIRAPATKPGWAVNELIPVAPATLPCEPPSGNTPLMQAVPICSDLAIDQAIVPGMQATPSCERP